MRPVLDMSRLAAPLVEVTSQIMPFTVQDSVPVVRDWTTP